MNRTSTDISVSTQAQAESLYEQVLDLQDLMINRGDLFAAVKHEVAFGKFLSNGETHIECTCGRGMFRPDNEAQLAYALHVADVLGLKVRMGRAA
jgi:hypothetical protein